MVKMIRAAVAQSAAALLIVTIALLVSAPAKAASLDFRFSFINPDDGAVIQGIIRGLTDDATSGATSVEVTSNSLGFGLGEYVGSPTDNEWVVAGGVIQSVNFESYGFFNTSPAVTCCSLLFVEETLGTGAVLANSDLASPTRSDSVSFTAINAVPLPASALLLFGSVVGFAGLGWLRRDLI